MSNEEMIPEGLPIGGMPPEAGMEGMVPEEGKPNKPKDKPKDKKAEDKLLEEMMYSPTSSDADAMLEIDKTTDVDEKRDITAKELLKMIQKDGGELNEKYRKELLDKALKDPTSVEVRTPRGWMTVKDAILDGFSLKDNDFTREPMQRTNWDEEISKLDPRDQKAIRNLTKPGTREAGPAPQEGMEQGGDMLPTPTGEPVPEQAKGTPVTDAGAMGGIDLGGGTALPLGGV